MPLTLRADAGAALHGRHHAELVVHNADDSVRIEHKTQFFAPEEK